MASVSHAMRIVQCHGCFDLLHIGHIRHFQAAKEAGDYLIVTVTPDRFVNKGPGRPRFPEALRMEAVKALACVDEVRLTDAPTAANAIRDIQPAVFAKGPDYSPETLDPGERDALAAVGGRLLITPTEKWSSTALLQTHAPEVETYLATIRSRYTFAEVQTWLEKARALQVLVIGDAIIDEYHYVTTLGKAGKEPHQVSEFIRSERFIGGTEAVAAHARACSDGVQCVTGTPIIKRRFVEQYPFQKNYEVYYRESGEPSTLRLSPEAISAADLVIVADYGHGLLTQFDSDRIVTYAQSLALNVQANAGNHGYNTISKYARADFVSISERELRLDARNQTRDVVALMRDYQRYGRLLVTRGLHGCMAMERGGFAEAPAFASHTVDRVGAGDAVFAVTACCAAVGMPLDLLTFVAAVVGTQAVGIVGNARYIERASLLSGIESWLR